MNLDATEVNAVACLPPVALKTYYQFLKKEIAKMYSMKEFVEQTANVKQIVLEDKKYE